MATFMDLNINFTKDKKTLQNIIETAAHRKYHLCSFSRKQHSSVCVMIVCLLNLNSNVTARVSQCNVDMKDKIIFPLI